VHVRSIGPQTCRATRGTKRPHCLHHLSLQTDLRSDATSPKGSSIKLEARKGSSSCNNGLTSDETDASGASEGDECSTCRKNFGARENTKTNIRSIRLTWEGSM